MHHKIFRYILQSFRVTEDGIHFGGFLLAFLYLILIGALDGNIFIVTFYLFQFGIIKGNFCRSAFIYNPHGDFIVDRFGHGVGVGYFTEYIQRSIDGCTCEAYIRSVWQ